MPAQSASDAPGGLPSSSPGRVDLQAPEDALWIARRLEAAGHEVWAVGGAVRDALSGNAPKDWDFTTSARPREVQRIFRRTVPVGIDHGTVGVIARSGRMYEVTTFRRDVETDGRRARVSFSSSLDDDLQRRDFTINAVAWSPTTGEVRDPHGGMTDLRERRLRTVGDPATRFEEDRLRALRALRFAGHFDLRIEERTWEAIQDYVTRLEPLSAERIREELWKILAAPAPPSRSLELYAASGALRELYPELDRSRGARTDVPDRDLWQVQLAATDAAASSRPVVRFAALTHGVGVAQRSSSVRKSDLSDGAARSAALARSILQRLRSSNADADRVTHLLAHLGSRPDTGDPGPAVRRWVRRLGTGYLNDHFRLEAAIAEGWDAGPAERRSIRLGRAEVARVIRSRVPLALADLAIDGSDLRGVGIPPGPLYGEILRDLLERVTDEPDLNDRERLLQIVRERIR